MPKIYRSIQVIERSNWLFYAIKKEIPQELKRCLNHEPSPCSKLIPKNQIIRAMRWNSIMSSPNRKIPT